MLSSSSGRMLPAEADTAPDMIEGMGMSLISQYMRVGQTGVKAVDYFSNGASHPGRVGLGCDGGGWKE